MHDLAASSQTRAQEESAVTGEAVRLPGSNETAAEGAPRWRALDGVWAGCLFVAALIIRLHWNLYVHPVGLYIYSDMKGYEGRARLYVERPDSSREYDAFFPPGTSWLLAIVKRLFGVDNDAALAVFYAVCGATIVLLAYLIARRLSRTPWVAPVVGLILVPNHLLVQQGGFVLSEIPMGCFLLLSVWLLLRVVDEGRVADAAGAGAAIAVAATIRPQALLSVGLLGLWWVGDRLARTGPRLPRLHARTLTAAALPLALVLGLCAWRVTTLTGRIGLISENGTLNLVFGRCHVKGIYALNPETGANSRFGPPPLIQLERHSIEQPDGFFQLDPVFALDASPVEGVPGFAIDARACAEGHCRLPGAELQYHGYIGDRALQRKIVSACIKRGGWARQLRYSITHVLQLWVYDELWPGQANPLPRPADPAQHWRLGVLRSQMVHNRVIAMPALLTALCVLVGFRRWPRHLAVAIHVPAFVLVAALYFGDIRIRLPYDPLLVILAVEGAAMAWAWLRVRVGWRRPTDQRISS